MARIQQGPARAQAPGVLEATVVTVLPNRRFRLRLPGGGEAEGHVGGAARMGISRIVPGDRVPVELSPLDRTQARIVGLPRARAGKSIHQRGQP